MFTGHDAVVPAETSPGDPAVPVRLTPRTAGWTHPNSSIPGARMADLSGKVAVVTGGSRGIGRAVALRLTGQGRRAVAIRADVSDPEQTGELMDQAATALGGLDILVSNAGIEHFDALPDITPADFDRVFATNTRGQLFAVQHAARHLAGGGRIVLMSSVSARKSVFHHTLYAASKAAVEAMALNLAPELAKRGITVNAIAPGGTRTDMSAEVSHHYAHPDLAVPPDAALRAMIAMGRLAEPTEIAATISFLVSPEAGYLTGRTIPVDGGFF
jgi:NAD(P)-dependent dehydrogenase (short-subunit alcohol dehydrogenase family)